MGGRGASSGIYKWKGEWHRYGDEYHTVYQYRNIKFVRINEGANTAPMETMTNGRVYVTVGDNNELKSITYYTGSGKRHKQIDLAHDHVIDDNRVQPHVHLGYKHNENGDRTLSEKEQKMVAQIIRLWNNYIARHS